MNELSIFIDESGDFGNAKEFPSYYLVTFVFHEQHKSIEDDINNLENKVREKGFNFNYIHTAPLIRRERPFHNLSVDERRQLLYCIFNFTIKAPISYKNISVPRSEAKNTLTLSGKLSKEIKNIIESNKEYFQKFNKIIVYYDNGQHELSVILNSVFNTYFSEVDFRTVHPWDYRLLQVADFICTMENLRIKQNENRLTKSEKMFFKPQELNKTFLKSITRKIL